MRNSHDGYMGHSHGTGQGCSRAIAMRGLLLTAQAAVMVLNQFSNGPLQHISAAGSNYYPAIGQAILQGARTSPLFYLQCFSVLAASGLLYHEISDVDEHFGDVGSRSRKSYRAIFFSVGLSYAFPAFVTINCGQDTSFDSTFGWVGLLGALMIGVFNAKLYAPLLTELVDKGVYAAERFLPKPSARDNSESLLPSSGSQPLSLAVPSVRGQRGKFAALSVGIVATTITSQLALTAALGVTGTGLIVNSMVALCCVAPEALWHASHWMAFMKHRSAIMAECRMQFSRCDWLKVALFSVGHGMLGLAAQMIAVSLHNTPLMVMAGASIGFDAAAALPESLIHVLDHALSSARHNHHCCHEHSTRGGDDEVPQLA